VSRWALPVLAALLAAAAGAGPAVAQDRGRILVVPFENVLRDHRILWLSEASAVLLADDLNALGVDAITREERQAAFARLQVPLTTTLTDATIIRIGELVGASEIIAGTLTPDGDDLVVQARRILLGPARTVRLAPQRGALSDLFDLFERLARDLVPADGRRAQIPLERPPVAAFENYVKGLVAETPPTALGYLNASLLAAPDFARARLALWDVYTAQGEHERALAAIRLVSGDSPFAARSRFLTGLSYLELERYDDAFETFQSVHEARPSAGALNNLGIVQLRRDEGRRAEEAAYYFRRATEEDGAQADYFFNLGYASWQARDVPAATFWLREAVRRNPADGDAHFVLAAALAAGGKAAEAARERELAHRLSSTYADWERSPAGQQVPSGLERVRRDVELPGVRWLEEALTAAGQRDQRELAAFYLERARRLYAEQRDREATADLNRSLFLDPYQAAAHLLLARIHLRAGRVAEAVEALKISLWSVETAEAHAVLAEALLELGDEAGARSAAARALVLDPAIVGASRVLDRIGGAP
jgi:tetratricopeptide (TPR) repeat protein